jgi:phage gp29-like protein
VTIWQTIKAKASSVKGAKKVSVPVAKKEAATSGVSKDLERILRPQAAYRWLLPQLAAITPQYIEMVLRGALAGSHVQAWELFDLMEDTWPRLTKDLNELKQAVIGLNWIMTPWAEEDEPPTDSAREKARLVSNALWKMRPDPCADENAFEATIYDILDAWGKGTAVLEVDWEIRRAGQLGDITAPRSTFWVHPTCYAWSQQGRLGLRTELLSESYRAQPNRFTSTSFQPMPGEVNEFPENKFLVAISKAKSGSPLGGALLRSLAWWWCAGNFSADWLMNLAQVFGLPFRWANYATGASQQTIDGICTMLENMGSAGWAAFPAGTTLELKEASKTGDASPQGDLLDRADRNCDLLILGQTLTSQAGATGSLALGKVHEGVKEDRVEAAASFAVSVVNNQLIPMILRLNYGDEDEAPEFLPQPQEKDDAEANAARDKVLLDAGVELPKDWFYKRHGVPIPEGGEEVIGGKKEEATSPWPSPPTAERESAVKGKNQSGLTSAATSEFAKAVATDLQPVAKRLAAIMAISDPEILRARLAAFLQEADQLAQDIAQDSAAASELRGIITQALVNGFAERQGERKPK